MGHQIALVTGAAGSIGGEMANHLSAGGHMRHAERDWHAPRSAGRRLGRRGSFGLGAACHRRHLRGLKRITFNLNQIEGDSGQANS